MVALTREIADLGKNEAYRILASIEEEMAQASEDLDFEQAAHLRDKFVELKQAIEGSEESEIIERLKKNARQGSYHGAKKRFNRHAKH